jgi:hypothetical protein
MGQAPFPQPTPVRTYTGERLVPQAKTLGLLVSLMFRRQAEAQGAYEALLINRKGEITEGTKSNFLVLEGQTILSPPKEDILWGVTLRTLQEATVAQGYRWDFRTLPLEKYQRHPGAFLTSTSVNVLPIGHWGGNNVTPSRLHQLHEIYQSYLLDYVESRKGIIFSFTLLPFLPIKRSEKGIKRYGRHRPAARTRRRPRNHLGSSCPAFPRAVRQIRRQAAPHRRPRPNPQKRIQVEELRPAYRVDKAPFRSNSHFPSKMSTQGI